MAKKEADKNLEMDQVTTSEVDETVKDLEKEIDAIKAKETPKNNPDEKVILEIPISETEQDDWWCCINGKSYLIQRGEKVLVPKAVKEVYDNQQRQRLESYKRSQALQKAAAAKKDRLAFD